MGIILEVDQKFPQPGIIEHAIEEISKNHGLIIYPTDTVYGLGCDCRDKIAVDKINFLKQREKSKNYSILFDTLKRLEQYVELSTEQKSVLEKYLPGEFTFILKAKKKTPSYLVSVEGNIGIRLPRNKLCQALVKELNSPIITTSANISGQKVITNPQQLDKNFSGLIDVILDAGELGEVSSTVVDLTSKPYRILRQGVGKFLEP